MRRWHFYVMGAIALGYGLLGAAEYVMVTAGAELAWLEAYSARQIAWLETAPAWIDVLWGVHAALALVGALCLLAHLRSAVWMLAFAFLTLAGLYVWMIGFAEPSVIAVTGGGWIDWTALALVLLLSFLIYVYARQEKLRGEVL